MSWWKQAKNFTERNTILHKISYLKELREELVRLSKVIFMSGTTAKQANVEIIQSKKITTYPNIHDILIEADHRALDSPWKFATLCNMAIERIDGEIRRLTAEKHRLTYGKDKPKKGWF